MIKIPPAWIINQIQRKQEHENNAAEVGRGLRPDIPPYIDGPIDDTDDIGVAERGIVDVDFTIESLIRQFIRESVNTIDDVRSEKPLPNGMTVSKLKEIFKSVPYEAQEVKKKFAELGFNVKWSRWNDRDGDKLAGECFTESGMRYFFEFHDLDPRVGRDHPLLVMFDNSGSDGWVQDDDGYLANARRRKRRGKQIAKNAAKMEKFNAQ